jgi:hypothetical protein
MRKEGREARFTRARSERDAGLSEGPPLLVQNHLKRQFRTYIFGFLTSVRLEEVKLGEEG